MIFAQLQLFFFSVLSFHLQETGVCETEERKMKVDVDDWTVWIVPGRKNHLKGAQTEGLTHTHTHALLNNTKRLHRAGEEL